MNEQRFVVTDRVWQRLELHLPENVSDARATTKNNRLFLEAVFWRVRTGATCRRPLETGQRFRRWAETGVFSIP